jgi:hypothetical protein
VIRKMERQLQALEAEVRHPVHRPERQAANRSSTSQAAAHETGPAIDLGTPSVEQAAEEAPEPPPPTNPSGREPTNKEIARALENTLINQGGLLLAPWVMQLVPDFGVTYSEQDQLAFVAPGVIRGTTNAGIVTQRSHNWDAEMGLSLRMGLPFGMQGQIRVPFDWAQGQAVLGGSTVVSNSRTGLGDIAVSLQKQLLVEDSFRPAVIANINYKAASGYSPLNVRQVTTFPFAAGTGSGFPTLSAGIVAQKRQDPLVFVGQIEYYHNFSETIDGLSQRPGDTIEMKFSPILAASPDTSLRVDWDTFFSFDNTINNHSVPGSGQTVSFLDIGVGSNLSARWFMDASVGVGLTRDSPGFRALLVFPYRF